MTHVVGDVLRRHGVLGLAVVLMLALVLLAGLLALLWRMLPADTHPCPDCLSDIPAAAAVCRYCTSEVRSST